MNAISGISYGVYLNKKINEDDKINLLKRRMKIFEKDNKELSKNQNAKKYFTKLLTALNG